MCLLLKSYFQTMYLNVFIAEHMMNEYVIWDKVSASIITLISNVITLHGKVLFVYQNVMTCQ